MHEKFRAGSKSKTFTLVTRVFCENFEAIGHRRKKKTSGAQKQILRDLEN